MTAGVARPTMGLVGLAVMGQNLALNLDRNGVVLAVTTRTPEHVKTFVQGRARGTAIVPCDSLEALVRALAPPRRIVLMVKAGAPVDETLGHLVPLLERGDVVIDGGNSYFRDTERRVAEAARSGVHFMGCGISGGEYGALWGPSIMPGGPRAAWDAVREVLLAVAARVDDEPCCEWLGPGGAGHYVKMVHNGIEYGDMELIAEAYLMLNAGLDLHPARIADIFEQWNLGPLESYLVEITATVLRKEDPGSGAPLVDLVVDVAGQKGTGKWTSQCAMDLGVPVPTIDAALHARMLSALRAERLAAAPRFERLRSFDGAPDRLVRALHDALYASKICAYAQGFALLARASAEYAWELDLATVARVWRGGCIIRARFLEEVAEAFRRRPDLPNLLLDDYFGEQVRRVQEHWRDVVQVAADLGLPVLAFGASLGYFDAYRRERLPANLIQAQRDHFGAHTYERIDRPGTFHTDWE